MKIFNKVLILKDSASGEGNILMEYKERFVDALNDNLNVSECFAILNDVLKSDNMVEDILATVYNFDTVLGFGLKDIQKEDGVVPDEIMKLVDERQKARESGNYGESDRLRDLISSKGYKVLDTFEGQVVEKV